MLFDALARGFHRGDLPYDLLAYFPMPGLMVRQFDTCVFVQTKSQETEITWQREE